MLAKLKRITRRLLFGIYNPRYYPAVIKKQYLEISNKEVLFDDSLIDKARDFYAKYLMEFSPIGNFEKTLRIMPNRSINLDPQEFWSTSGITDKEKAFFLHRFYWLNENRDTENHNVLEALVDFWVANLKNHSIAQTPYNASERIVNCAKFICHKPSVSRAFTEKLCVIIKYDALLLIHEIEFPHTGVFNNHIINNARAIIWAALIFSREDLGRFAQEIACYAHKNLFDENGCLNEASFHYQLIVTKRLKEISIISKEFFEFDYSELNIDPTVLKTQRLISFLEKRSIKKLPLIGDVSPDMPTTLSFFSELLPREINSLSDPGIACLGSWFVLHNSRFLIYLNAHQYGSSAYPNDHGHDDFISFVLFHDADPVFVDPGNLSYESHIYNEYQESSAHNKIICSQVNTDIVGRTVHWRTGRLQSICLSQFYSCGRVLKRYIHVYNDSVFLTDMLLRGKPYEMKYCQFQLGSQIVVDRQGKKCKLFSNGGQYETLSITGYSEISVAASKSSGSYGLMKQTQKLICYTSDANRNVSRAQVSCR